MWQFILKLAFSLTSESIAMTQKGLNQVGLIGFKSPKWSVLLILIEKLVIDLTAY